MANHRTDRHRRESRAFSGGETRASGQNSSETNPMRPLPATRRPKNKPNSNPIKPNFVLNGERTERSATRAQDGWERFGPASEFALQGPANRFFDNPKPRSRGLPGAAPGFRPVVLRPVDGALAPFPSSARLSGLSISGLAYQARASPPAALASGQRSPNRQHADRKSSQRARGPRHQCRFRTQTGPLRNALTFYTSGSNM